MIRQSETARLLRGMASPLFARAPLSHIAEAQTIDDGYNPYANGAVNVLLASSDGKTLVTRAFLLRAIFQQPALRPLSPAAPC